MLAQFKRFDGQALGADKCGEGEEKAGEIPIPPHTTPMNKFAPKLNHLRSKLDTTPDPPVFPHKAENYQKPIKFVSTQGSVFGGKSGEKAVEKPIEKPQPKPQPIRFHCEYCGRDGHKDEFCFRRKRHERFAREMANKDRYHLPHGVPEPRRGPLPRGEVFVRTVPTRGGRGMFPQRERRVGFSLSETRTKCGSWI